MVDGPHAELFAERNIAEDERPKLTALGHVNPLESQRSIPDVRAWGSSSLLTNLC